MTTSYFNKRLEEVTQLKNAGDTVYCNFTGTITFSKFIQKYKDLKVEGKVEVEESLAGRVIVKKDNNDTVYYTLYRARETVNAHASKELASKSRIKRGDIVGICGYPFIDDGKVSIQIKSIKLLAPCLHAPPPPPIEVTKLTLGSPRDTPKCLKPTKNRIVDPIMSDERIGIFQTRSEIISYVRKFFQDREFLEVETPILDYIPGVGAGAPFATNFNKNELYLRVAPEVNLKRLLVGGLDRVFEIGKQFRNESIDASHHPEFTSCEAYMAFADYNNMMKLTEVLLSGLVEKLNKGLIVNFPADDSDGESVQIDFTPPFRRLDILDELKKLGGIVIPGDLCGEEANKYLRKACDNLGVVCNPPKRTARLLDKLIDCLLVPTCINPTFVINHPRVMSLMAKSHESEPDITERFELYINKQELCNAYSELNDPIEQRERFSELLKELKPGDSKATELDEAFCESLEYGLPPAAGWGIGLDRLVMLLTCSSAIKDVLTFPLQKPKKRKLDPAVQSGAAGTEKKA